MSRVSDFYSSFSSIIYESMTVAESVQLGLENVSSIAKVPGVNVLMVGVGDLKASLGLPTRNIGEGSDESKFHNAITKMIATSKETGMHLMIPEFKLKAEDVDWLKEFKMILISVDILSVPKSHRQDLARAREVMGVPQ